MQTSPADRYRRDSRHTSVISPLVVYNSIGPIQREVKHSATPDISSYDSPVRNAGDAISMVQTADGAVVEISTMLQRSLKTEIFCLQEVS